MARLFFFFLSEYLLKVGGLHKMYSNFFLQVKIKTLTHINIASKCTWNKRNGIPPEAPANRAFIRYTHTHIHYTLGKIQQLSSFAFQKIKLSSIKWVSVINNVSEKKRTGIAAKKRKKKRSKRRRNFLLICIQWCAEKKKKKTRREE